MSDDSDFDKEAERERLREKYERDQKKREQSERMSELLLQGATMTNRHCGECGDPIFRHEGKEFCPTCQKQVGTVDAEAEASETDATEAEAADEQPAETQAQADTPTQTGGQRGQGQPRKANGHASPQEEQQPTQSQRPSQTQPQQPTQQTGREAGGRTPAPATDTGGSPSGGLADAEASLARTIEKYARGAEESGDVGRARDYLAAVREAAEALEAVRRAE